MLESVLLCPLSNVMKIRNKEKCKVARSVEDLGSITFQNNIELLISLKCSAIDLREKIGRPCWRNHTIWTLPDWFINGSWYVDDGRRVFKKNKQKKKNKQLPLTSRFDG